MKLLRWLPVVAGAALLARRFGPEMGRMCERMFERMPDCFPPKQMLRHIIAIREQNERIIRLLEEHARAGE